MLGDPDVDRIWSSPALTSLSWQSADGAARLLCAQLGAPLAAGGLAFGDAAVTAATRWATTFVADVPWLLSRLPTTAVTWLRQLPSQTDATATTWLTDLAHLPPPVAGSMPTWAQVIAGAIPERLTREMVALAAELPLHQLLREATLPPPASFRIQELAADPGGLGLSYASASPRLERFRIPSAALRAALRHDLGLPQLDAPRVVACLRAQCACRAPIDLFGAHATTCKLGVGLPRAQEQHATLNQAISEFASIAGCSVRSAGIRVPTGAGGSNHVLADRVLYGLRERSVAFDGGIVASARVVPASDSAPGRVVIHGEAVSQLDKLHEGLAAPGFVPAPVAKYEDAKRRKERMPHDQAGMDFVPGVLSQHGCMGDSLRGLLDELATAGSQSLAVQLIFNCASAGEARGSLLSFWKRSLSVVHARAKGTRIAHFYQHVEHVPPAGSAHSAPLPHRSEFTPSSRALPAPSAWPDRGDFALPFSHKRAHFARALEHTVLPSLWRLLIRMSHLQRSARAGGASP
ncbi:hypothetical protein RI054_12g62380 [Pseudoscourfieldia marina]